MSAYQAGKSIRQIARDNNVSHPTIIDLLHKYRQSSQVISEFRSARADLLAQLHAQALALQCALIADLERDRLAGALSPAQKSALLHSLTVAGGTAFDKERLERGQSSHNISVLSKLIDTTIQSAYEPVTPPVVGSGSSSEPTNASD